MKINTTALFYSLSISSRLQSASLNHGQQKVSTEGLYEVIIYYFALFIRLYSCCFYYVLCFYQLELLVSCCFKVYVTPDEGSKKMVVQ